MTAWRHVTGVWPLVVWVAYLLWPASWWGLFHGVPLAPLAWPMVGAVVWSWCVRRGLPATRWLLLLLALKALSPFVAGERGLAAEYFANAAWTPPAERDVEARGARGLTRIDRRLRFGATGAADLPLFFFNDPTRFNFYRSDEPDRRKLAYSVVWSGFLSVPDRRSATFYLEGARGVSAELTIDGFQVVALSPADAEAEGTVPLRSGWRRVTVRLSGEYGAPRQFEAGWTDGRRRVPLGDEDVFVARMPGWRVTIARFVRWLSLAADATVLILAFWNVSLAILTMTAGLKPCTTADPSSAGLQACPSRWDLPKWRRSVAALAFAAAIADALALGWRWSGRLVVLRGGDDWITYEHYARDILLNGPLMRLGHPPDEGAPYYYQALYPYCLALLHLVFGNDFGGVYAAQRLLLIVTAFAVWRLTALMFGERSGAAGFAIATIFLYHQAGLWASVLPSEIVFVPLVCLWAWSLMRLCAPRTSGAQAGGPPATASVIAGVAAGVAGGLATLARSTLLLAWPAAITVLLSNARARSRRPGLAIAVMLAVAGLATARNWHVSGEFVPITTGFSGNFYLGNVPPPDVPQHSIAEHRFYPLLAREDTLRMTLEFARHAPRRFTAGLGRKALYTLGWFDAMTPGAGTSGLLVATWVAALAGVVIAMRRGSGALGRWPLLLPALLSLAHFVSVVLIFPHGGFERRLILPMYVLLLPYVAAAATEGWVRILRSRPSCPNPSH